MSQNDESANRSFDQLLLRNRELMDAAADSIARASQIRRKAERVFAQAFARSAALCEEAKAVKSLAQDMQILSQNTQVRTRNAVSISLKFLSSLRIP
ncbi:hypothetical protein [Azospirillum canadense]|uniref:hypothetical protein n=1 Tax=Azospirillum canadense TaxID=403962 RepID=UPI00222763FA|nr:hypothetical protein [Azospirillum canadense]MCW2239151.1 hypothetical protein [Azospirillum canadense]